MEKIIGIIDEPNPRGSNDQLGIDRHSKALIEFIKKAPTPLTIGVQGEWGSGKTSILNSIYHDLSQYECYKQIWVNSWESSLLSTPAEALLKIINEILEELLGSDSTKSKQETIKGITNTIFRGALRVGASMALGDKAAEVASELLGGKSNSIKELRNHLESLSLEIRDRKTNPYTKIIVYIDDLDRIEPQYAVQILELLKNIFNISGCIFVLAIDYQVVVKGLQHKFGPRTDENEWEFRAFFDKIIQLPFMMPMGQYDIGRYVKTLLHQVGFFNDQTDIDEQDVKQIVSYTIGGNPRSLKRLANSLALIDLFIEMDSHQNEAEIEIDEKNKKLLLLAFVCIQIAYPDIYNVFSKNPDFTKWDEKFALQITKRKEEEDKENFSKNFQIAIESGDEFDEEWEQALYRICYTTPKYRSKVNDISKLFNFIKSDILGEYNENFLEILLKILGETNVTSVITNENIVETPKIKYSSVKLDTWDAFEHSIKQRDAKNNKTTLSLPLAKKMVEFVIAEYKDAVKVVFTEAGSITFNVAAAKGRKKVFTYIALRAKANIQIWCEGKPYTITEDNFETEGKSVVRDGYKNFLENILD